MQTKFKISFKRHAAIGLRGEIVEIGGYVLTREKPLGLEQQVRIRDAEGILEDLLGMQVRIEQVQ